MACVLHGPAGSTFGPPPAVVRTAFSNIPELAGMSLSINLLDRTLASRVIVELGREVREFVDCLVAMDADGRAVHIWERGNERPRPSLSVPLAAAFIEWPGCRTREGE